MIVYYYTSGDEDVQEFNITIESLDQHNFRITFTQESLNPEYFKQIISEYKELSRTNQIQKESIAEGVIMVKQITEIKIKTQNNPRPEELFKIIRD